MSRLILAMVLISAALLPLLALADEPQPKPPVLPTAKMVTLSGKMKVSEALAALTKQTGIVIEDRRGEPDAVRDFENNKATFWQVLDHVAAVADAQVDLYSPDGKLALKKGTGKTPVKGAQTVSYDGLFRTAIKNVTGSIDLETGQTTWSAALEVAWEPTLQPFYLETRPQNLVITVNDKALPRVDLGKAQAPVDGRNALLFETPFPTLPRAVKQIEKLEGQLFIIAPSKMLTFSFPVALDELEATAKGGKPYSLKQKGNQGDILCEVSKITFDKNLWRVKMTLDYPPGNTELGSYQSWLVNNELVLQSKDGKTRLLPTTYYLDPATATHASMTYNFQDDPKQNRMLGKPADWKLSYRTPEAVVTIPISFSFKNVPLP